MHLESPQPPLRGTTYEPSLSLANTDSCCLEPARVEEVEGKGTCVVLMALFFDIFPYYPCSSKTKALSLKNQHVSTLSVRTVASEWCDDIVSSRYATLASCCAASERCCNTLIFVYPCDIKSHREVSAHWIVCIKTTALDQELGLFN